MQIPLSKPYETPPIYRDRDRDERQRRRRDREKNQEKDLESAIVASRRKKGLRREERVAMSSLDHSPAPGSH
jgi:hypothetical protein